MSLIHTVSEMVKERGTASPEDLMPLITTHTRSQVYDAFKNAVRIGRLHRVGRAPSERAGHAPGVYAHGPKPDGLVVSNQRENDLSTRLVLEYVKDNDGVQRSQIAEALDLDPIRVSNLLFKLSKQGSIVGRAEGRLTIWHGKAGRRRYASVFEYGAGIAA